MLMKLLWTALFACSVAIVALPNPYWKGAVLLLSVVAAAIVWADRNGHNNSS